MADDLLTLAEMATINDRNLADINVSDLLDQAPFLAVLPAEGASNGTTHKYVKETAAPVVGFRAVNDGRDHDVSEDTLVTTNLAILDASFKVDAALASEWKMGAADWLDRELERHLRAAFFKTEQQFFYGTTAQGDTAGFAAINDELDVLADAMVLDGGGSTALSSVYFVRAGVNDCVAILGNEGRIDVAEDPKIIEVAGATGTFPAYYVPVTGWVTLQLGSKYSILRLANINTTGAAGSLTDDLLADAVSEFPSNKQPTHIVMHRYALRDLRKSRTATNPTGREAELPDNFDGIPIITTDAIRTDETAVV